jgi:hypothetical protein
MNWKDLRFHPNYVVSSHTFMYIDMYDLYRYLHLIMKLTSEYISFHSTLSMP